WVIPGARPVPPSVAWALGFAAHVPALLLPPVTVLGLWRGAPSLFLLLLLLLVFELFHQSFVVSGIGHLGSQGQGLVVGLDGPLQVPELGQGIAPVVVAIGARHGGEGFRCGGVIPGPAGGDAPPAGVFKVLPGQLVVAPIQGLQALLVLAPPQVLPQVGTAVGGMAEGNQQ